MSVRTVVGVWALALMAFMVAQGCEDQQQQGAALPSEPVAVTIDEGSLAGQVAADRATSTETASVLLTGSSEAHRRTTLGPSVSGTVRAVLAEEGQAVKAGDILVQLDTTDFDLQLRQVNAQIAAARVQVDAAKIEADRAEKLVAGKAVPTRQLDQASAQLRAAKAQVRVATVQKAMVERAIYESDIRAPYDAVVIRRHISEGESATAQPPTNLLTIEQQSPVDVRLEVPSVRIERVKVGTPLRLRFPATGYEVTASVTRVIPTVDPRTRSGAVIVALDNAAGRVRPGLFVEAAVVSAPDGAPAANAQGARPVAPDSAAPEVIQ